METIHHQSSGRKRCGEDLLQSQNYVAARFYSSGKLSRNPPFPDHKASLARPHSANFGQQVCPQNDARDSGAIQDCVDVSASMEKLEKKKSMKDE